MIEMTNETALLLASSTGVGVLMMKAGIEKKMLEWRRQQRICAGCDVRLLCLEHALSHHERYGVWGGLTATERTRIRRERRGRT